MKDSEASRASRVTKAAANPMRRALACCALGSFPAMIRAVFDNAAAPRPTRRFTVGIYDDVTDLSLPVDRSLAPPRPAGEVQAVFFGLGSDGTVGSNKNSIKIIGEGARLHAQGYFVYDSKKSGAVTVSHLRFGPRPIRSTYRIRRANFVACHQPGLMERLDVLDAAAPGATFLLNTAAGPGEVWDTLPREAQLMCLYAGANSIFYGDRLLTTDNPAEDADRELLRAAGLRTAAPQA